MVIVIGLHIQVAYRFNQIAATHRLGSKMVHYNIFGIAHNKDVDTLVTLVLL